MKRIWVFWCTDPSDFFFKMYWPIFERLHGCSSNSGQVSGSLYWWQTSCIVSFHHDFILFAFALHSWVLRVWPADVPFPSPHIAAIVSGVLAGLIVCLAVVVMALLYRRGLAIRRKRALRRYLASGEVTTHNMRRSLTNSFIPNKYEVKYQTWQGHCTQDYINRMSTVQWQVQNT